MKEMTLESANITLEKLKNDKKYWEKRLEQILSLVTPKSGNMDDLKVDGGIKIDKLLMYTDIKEELQIDSTLKYINDKIKAILEWKQAEMERLTRQDIMIPKIMYFKEEVLIKDKYSGKTRHLTWDEIAKNCYCSRRTAINKYNKGIAARKQQKTDIYIQK